LTLQVNANANLFSIVKNIIVRSYDNFQETTRDILWLNYTLHGLSELYTATRQLELALLLMIQKVSDLLGAIQSVLQGKLPISLTNTATLQNMLRNISLHLPPECELKAGTRADNIYLH
jgi:hypothetical protein